MAESSLTPTSPGNLSATITKHLFAQMGTSERRRERRRIDEDASNSIDFINKISPSFRLAARSTVVSCLQKHSDRKSRAHARRSPPRLPKSSTGTSAQKHPVSTQTEPAAANAYTSQPLIDWAEGGAEVVSTCFSLLLHEPYIRSATDAARFRVVIKALNEPRVL